MTTDVYKDEFLQQLKQSHIYKALVNKCGEKDSEVIACTLCSSEDKNCYPAYGRVYAS